MESLHLPFLATMEIICLSTVQIWSACHCSADETPMDELSEAREGWMIHILPDGDHQGKIHFFFFFLRVIDVHCFSEKHDYLNR